MGLERRGCVVQPWPRANWKREEPVDEAKPFAIPKREVWEAFKRVKANQGAAGVDGQSIAEFEADLSDNLYKLWNRLSSGSYFPPPVLRVDIPKADGGTRPLGIPTVADRVAQEVARRYLEPILEPVFHRQLLRLQARQICDRCRGQGSRALLALRLGARPRRQGLLRQYRLGADAHGGSSSYGLPVGAALRRALAEGAGADGGWQRRWARRKFKRMRHQTKGARDWFDRFHRANPKLFAHWSLCHGNGRTSGAV